MYRLGSLVSESESDRFKISLDMLAPTSTQTMTQKPLPKSFLIQLEREGMPPYPYEIQVDYCLMTGEDLENDDPQAWEATGKLIEVNASKLIRISDRHEHAFCVTSSTGYETSTLIRHQSSLI